MVTTKMVAIIELLREEGFLVTTEFMSLHGSNYMSCVILEINQIDALGFLPSNVGENRRFEWIIRMT